MTAPATHVDEASARRFLELRRIAVIGASPERGNFGAAVALALRDHGTDVVTVHPSADAVADLPSYADIFAVPGGVDGAVVMVPATSAAGVVRQCVDAGVHHVWLFRGIGGRGSVSEEALAVADAAGLDIVAGACPLMFLEPVGWFHHVHRSVRKRRGALVGG